jgi:hypothetical protein
VPFPLPAHVAGELVDRIESLAFDQTLGQAERHRGVVSPLARPEVERSAADDVVERFEGAWR